MRPFRPFRAPPFVKTPTRLLSLSTYALLGAFCLTACAGEDDPKNSEGSGTGNGNKGGNAGSGSLGVGGNGNRGGSAGSAGTGGSAGESGAGGTAGKGGSAGTAGKGGSAGNAGKGGSAGAAGKAGSAGDGQGGSDAGAAGTSAGAAGFGGGNIACSTVADCPGPAATNECGGWVCEQSLCFSAFAAKDKVASIQKPGDCVTKVCDGAGALVDRADPTDLPDDNNDCTKGVCTGTVPSQENLAAGDACGNGLACDGAGQCTGCGKASDCQAGDACKTATCTKGVCGFAFSAPSTPLPDATAKDCKRAACDGAGHIVEVASATDLPIDGTVCTQDVCVNGVPGNLPTNLGQPCEDGGLCNDAGKCVACLEPSTCPGQDTECAQRTCDNNVCGIAFVDYGTSVLNQTAGDCTKNVCDGKGKVINVVDDADVADDDNACTTDACNVGIVSHEPVSSGTSCGTNLLCNATGQCVGCVTANDCAGTDDACKTRTCLGNVCGIAYAPNGTALPDPTDGDCKGRFCDGAGNVIDGADPADVRVDGNVCSRDLCYNGNPANPASPAGTDCGNGNICSGTGACVQCLKADTCPGQDNECQTRTCVAGTCGLVFAPANTVIDTQITGDCLVNVCDGAGKVVSQANGEDVRNDNNACTTDTCTAGGPVNTPVTPGQPCGEGGVCEAGGVCGGCKSSLDCPGIENECQRPVCNEGLCGTFYQEDGTPLESGQTAQDCKLVVCDGAGNTKSISDGEDLPADDGIACTSEICVGSNPAHPPKPQGASCLRGQGAGFCDGGTSCVECNIAENCPGQDTFCSFRTCTNGACGIGRMPANTDLPAALQNAGDCQKLQCDDAGGVKSQDDDGDKPAADSNECTVESCAEGSPYSFPTGSGSTCTVDGVQQVCDGEGSCVVCVEDAQCTGGKVCTNQTCVAPGPQVVDTTPKDGASGVDPRTPLVLTFNMAMGASSLTAQTTNGTCAGAIQLSADNFATCVAFASALATPNAGNTTATLQPKTGLAVNTVYAVRVTNAATNEAGVPLQPYQHKTGFKTGSLAGLCDGDLVISQIYGNGGNASASFNRDFVEIHNRGSKPVALGGWSVQYASATGTSWAPAPLADTTLAAGGYYLVAFGPVGTSGAALPTPQTILSGTQLSGSAGKVALVRSTTALSGDCPLSNANLVDLVGYGAAATCSLDGKAPVPGDNAKSILRNLSGCQDARNNAEDFAASAGNATPRNTSTTAVVCDCRAINETGPTEEVDACQLVTTTTSAAPNGPTTALAGTALISGSTGAGHVANLRVQVGYGPLASNPQYDTGWSWAEAAYGSEAGANGENFSGILVPPGPANRTLSFVYRASRDGLHWTYCDSDGSGSGTATFDPAKQGTLNVLGVPQ